MKLPAMSDILAPIIVASLVGAGSSYGTFVAMDTRLTAVEGRLNRALTQERSEEWGALRASVSDLRDRFETRAGDQAFADWISWRAVIDSWRARVDADISSLERDAARRPP